MAELWMPPGTVIEHGPGKTPEGLQDDLIGENTIGGPLSGDDVRMMLDRDTLRRLLNMAEQSMVNRVILHRVGFKQRIWRGGDGNVYQTLQLISAPPKPESAPFGPGRE